MRDTACAPLAAADAILDVDDRIGLAEHELLAGGGRGGRAGAGPAAGPGGMLLTRNRVIF